MYWPPDVSHTLRRAYLFGTGEEDLGTTSVGSDNTLVLDPVGARPVKGARYRLRPRNNHPLYTWVVKKGLSVKR